MLTADCLSEIKQSAIEMVKGEDQCAKDEEWS